MFARVTYDLRGTELKVSAEQAWPVSPGLWKTEYGPMDPDTVFYRGGVDLFVFGAAYADAGREVEQLEVKATVGAKFQHRIQVFGDRFWQKQGGKFKATAPKPFREMPLAFSHAYGGKDVWDELEIAYPDNPDGKGYVYEAETAEGKPLPNLEDPDRLIRDWSDRPDPVGTGACSMGFSPRLKNGVEVHSEPIAPGIKKINPVLFNAAFPGMVVPEVQPGDPVAVSGVSPAGPVRFRLPARLPLQTRIKLGDKLIERPLHIDQIGIEPDKKRVFVAYRYHFRYTMVPLQKRLCELLPS